MYYLLLKLMRQNVSDAPDCFYLRLHNGVSKVHVLPSPLDAGLFAHFIDTRDLTGVIAYHIDDLHDGGTSEFQFNDLKITCCS